MCLLCVRHYQSPGAVRSSPTATVTNDHKLSSFKQHTFTLWWSWRLGVLKLKCQKDCIPPAGFRREHTALPLPASRAFLAHELSPHLQSPLLQPLLFLIRVLLVFLVQGRRDCPGHTWITQANLPISRSTKSPLLCAVTYWQGLPRGDGSLLSPPQTGRTLDLFELFTAIVTGWEKGT